MSDILLIRADAGTRMGTGHVMRCIALGQAWRDSGGDAVFAVSDLPLGIETRLGAEGMRVTRIGAPAGSTEDARSTIVRAELLGASWTAVDGYHFGPAYQRVLKAGGCRVLLIDDFGNAAPYCTDVVLNQNIAPGEDMYHDRCEKTRLLLGTRYTLLRREFRIWHAVDREMHEDAGRILVTLGGGDQDNVTLKVIEGISKLESGRIHAKVIAGVANPHIDILRRVCGRSPRRIELETNITAMPELMAWADIAVTAGGTTCWEMAFMGVPNVIIVLAGNQYGISRQLADQGVSVNLGWYERVSAEDIGRAIDSLLRSPETRMSMSRAGRSLVDGDGAARVCAALRNGEGQAI